MVNPTDHRNQTELIGICLEFIEAESQEDWCDTCVLKSCEGFCPIRTPAFRCNREHNSAKGGNEVVLPPFVGESIYNIIRRCPCLCKTCCILCVKHVDAIHWLAATGHGLGNLLAALFIAGKPLWLQNSRDWLERKSRKPFGRILPGKYLGFLPFLPETNLGMAQRFDIHRLSSS